MNDIVRRPVQPRVVLDTLRDQFADLVDRDHSYQGEAALTFFIDIPFASQVSRIANSLERIDHAVRRATAVFESNRDSDGYYRLTSSLTSGLVIESVSIGSYHGRHRLQGQSQKWASRHPFQFALLVLVLGGVHDAYLLPHYPGTGDDPQPPVIAPQHPRESIEIDLGGAIRLSDLEPPTAGGGGAPADVTIVIEGADGATAIKFTSKPRPPRRGR